MTECAIGIFEGWELQRNVKLDLEKLKVLEKDEDRKSITVFIKTWGKLRGEPRLELGVHLL